MKHCFAFIAAAALAGCASLPHPVDHPAPGTSPAPEQTWTAPKEAVPPEVAASLKTVAPPSGPLSLAQLIDVALANNPATRTAWLEARAAEAALGSSRADYLPQVDLNVTAGTTHSASSGSRAASTTTSIVPSISLDYLLFDFGGRNAGVEQARQALIAADYLHNQSIQDVILRVETAYYSYLETKALLDAQDATLKERRTALDAAEARHNAGVATIADVLQAKTGLSQAQLTYETIEGNLRTIEGSLATAMGLRPTERFDIGTLPLDIPSKQVTAAIDTLLARAEVERPQLAAARASALQARARVIAVRSSYMPSIGVTATAGESFSGGLRNAQTPYSAGVALRFPLFTGWRNVYDIRRAELQAELADEDLRALRQDVDLQVWTSYYALQTATKRVSTTRDLLASASQSVDVASNRYKAGVGSILELLTAESALETARAQEVQARTDWFVAVAQLAHDTGSLGR